MNLSLWNIEAELAELLDLREEIIEHREDLRPVDSAIAEYIAREVRKVDSIRGYIRHAEMMVAAAKVEAQSQSERAKVWQGRIDRLKEACRCVMEAMPWQVGKSKRIDGKTGSLLLKANGGAQPVIITKPELIPEDLVQYEGRISGEAWTQINELMESGRCDKIDGQTAGDWWKGRQDVQMERIPHKGRIGEALKAACPVCNGTGLSKATDCPCRACDGDGKARVPGAHLAERGMHVDIK